MHGWFAGARIAGTKGLEGKLRLKDASAFLHHACVGVQVAFVPPAEDRVRFAQVAAIEEAADASCLVSFSEVSSAGAAQALVGCTVLLAGVKPQGLEDPAGLRGLSGFALVDTSLGYIGVVEDVDDAPNRFQPLLQVKLEGREAPALIPLVEELVESIDEEGRRIVMSLPKGILDI